MIFNTFTLAILLFVNDVFFIALFSFLKEVTEMEDIKILEAEWE